MSLRAVRWYGVPPLRKWRSPAALIPAAAATVRVDWNSMNEKVLVCGSLARASGNLKAVDRYAAAEQVVLRGC
jgi:hypothetical protein